MKLITRKRAGSLVTSAVFITTAFPMSGCHPLLPFTPLILLGQGVDYTANALANATYTEETSPTVLALNSMARQRGGQQEAIPLVPVENIRWINCYSLEKLDINVYQHLSDDQLKELRTYCYSGKMLDKLAGANILGRFSDKQIQDLSDQSVQDADLPKLLASLTSEQAKRTLLLHHL